MTEFERRIWRQFQSLLDGFSKWWTNMRDTDAAKRAASTLADLRQREPVKKAEESARRAFADLRSGRGNGGSTSES